MSFRRRRRQRQGSSGEATPEAGAAAPTEGAPAASEPGPAASATEPSGKGPAEGTAASAGEPSEAAGAAASADESAESADDSEETKGLISGTRAALAPVKKRHILIASAGVMGFVFAGTLLFAAVSFWWTSQPSFCGRCHVMEPYINAWKESPHQDVQCESCHLTPGFFGFVGGKIAGLQVVANYIRGDYEDWSFNAAVSNASCLQCHEDILAKNIHSVDTGVIVSHKDIIETGGKCMFCHSTVAHGGAVAAGSATHPTMQTCLTCHNDQIAPLDCDLCHVGKEPPSEAAASPPGTG